MMLMSTNQITEILTKNGIKQLWLEILLYIKYVKSNCKIYEYHSLEKTALNFQIKKRNMVG